MASVDADPPVNRLAAAACWLIFSVIFIECSEPKVVVGLFGALAVAAAITG
jgi:hypothetical protein